MTRKKLDERPLTAKDVAILNRTAKRAKYLATRMVYEANHRPDKEKGDPKIGGHAAASASTLHIAGSLHLWVKTGFDFMAVKPHASPTDHSYNYLLDLLLDSHGQPLPAEVARQTLFRLRKFPDGEAPVFQSYHSSLDPDHRGFIPSGTVGIPPVNVGYLALAHRYCKDQGWNVPDPAHFWAICGDSEFREGSIFEAAPEFAERELGNLTWILDYNRQSLDGHRITNHRIMGGSDADRIARTFEANGWKVWNLKHGSFRQSLFQKKGGEALREFLDQHLLDYELQALLLMKDHRALKTALMDRHPEIRQALQPLESEKVAQLICDLGGHDFEVLIPVLQECRRGGNQPHLVIAHTIKGWGLAAAAAPGNHNSLPEWEEVEALREEEGIPAHLVFDRFPEDSEEGRFCKQRGNKIREDFINLEKLRRDNEQKWKSKIFSVTSLPREIQINFKMASYPHTQWMMGQLNAKLNRIALTDPSSLKPEERPWHIPASLMVTMAPDVGTSTNLNPLMDGKIFGAAIVDDIEKDLGVKDSKTPDLVPNEKPDHRFIRFEIAEANTMSCVGSFGKIKDFWGIPLLPVMSVYDFFIKRAHDQLFYNLYWKSGFILLGTPSGVTLSPEGAQHGWKSDFQIPGQITWEPFFCQELDWILADAISRHMEGRNEGRSGVLIRCVTRGVEQRDFLKFLRMQSRFKMNPSEKLHPPGKPLPGAVPADESPSLSDQQILEVIREEVLAGAYPLILYRGYAGYEEGDNVVHIFSMGSPTTEAISASLSLLDRGIYANVFVVTSPDLLAGHLGWQNGYEHLQRLGIHGNLVLKELHEEAEKATLSGMRVPIVSVHDGEPGLLDNLGSIVGVKQIALAVRKHSKCGKPSQVYHYHGIDAKGVEEACLAALDATARETVIMIHGDGDSISRR